MTPQTHTLLVGEILGALTAITAVIVMYTCIYLSTRRGKAPRPVAHAAAISYVFVLLPASIFITPVVTLVLIVVALLLEAFTQGI